MATTWEQLAEEAMTLSRPSRAKLAACLVESLDLEEPGPIDQRWVAEALRRRDEVRPGSVEIINIEGSH